MTVDMFQSKTQLLEGWAKAKGFFSKADIMQYGLDTYYLRAPRTIRQLVRQGKVKKLDKKECAFRGFSTKMAFYEYVGRAK